LSEELRGTRQEKYTVPVETTLRRELRVTDEDPENYQKIWSVPNRIGSVIFLIHCIFIHEVRKVDKLYYILLNSYL